MTSPDSFFTNCRQKGLLLDANLLTLLVVGTVNPRRIPTFRRTSAYDQAAFDLLLSVTQTAKRLHSLPHILAEVSNLTDLKGNEALAARFVLRSIIDITEEMAIASRIAAAHSTYQFLGLTDAAIIAAIEAHQVPVLTADLRCYDLLLRSNLVAVNFTHLRRIQLGID